MTLPNFLGLGTMRAGSTWLDRLLRQHPRAYLPRGRKEVHFFNQHYERGIAWYETFFPNEFEAARYDAIGEFSPKYLYDPATAARIHRALPECKFLIILRNPADRAYSDYKAHVQHRGERREFAQYLRDRPEIFDQGCYGAQIERYFDLFPRERFHILLFEKAVATPHETRRSIAEFLSLDPGQFAPEAAAARSWPNRSTLPRFPRAYLFGKRLSRALRHGGQDWLVRLAIRLGMRELLRDGSDFSPPDPGIRRELLNRYAEDIAKLEALLGVDLGFWLDADQGKPLPLAA